MDAEDFKLKYRISQLSEEELLEMIRNHLQYRQLALDLAMAQLSERKITFTPPPPKPIMTNKKTSVTERILTIAGFSGGIVFFYWWSQQIMNHPEGVSGKEAFRFGVLLIIFIFAIFIGLMRLLIYGLKED